MSKPSTQKVEMPEIPEGVVPVFLLECRSGVERRILMQWLKGQPACVDIDLSGKQVVVMRSRQKDSASAITAIAEWLESPLDLYFLPVRILWSESDRAKASGVKLSRLVFGDRRTPGVISQRVLLWRDRNRAQALPAAGASVAELRDRLEIQDAGAGRDTGTLARFIYRQAMLALDRAERDVRGFRYKVPRLIEEEVLSKPRLVSALAREAERSGRGLEELLAEARVCLQEMAPQVSTFALDMMTAFGRYLYTRGFDSEVGCLPEDLERVRGLLRKHPVAFLMTHKSHIDGFLLWTLFHDLDFPPVHVFGGINMSFLGLGYLGRRAGAIFIRRNMAGDNVYKAVFKQYIDYLAEKRFPLLWALEGTRSRTGKLMPPRYGLINYVADSYLRQSTTDMVLLPVSVAYDQVPEVGDYIAEQRGVSKRPESASWFMQYISGLKNPFGKIHVRFGQGVALSQVIGEPRPGMKLSSLDIQKIAFQLAVDTNSVTPVLGSGLIAYVLSEHGTRAYFLSELQTELRAMLKYVRARSLPTAGIVELDDDEQLQVVLGQMVQTGLLQRFDEGSEPMYAIAPDSNVAASYYRNAIVHFLFVSAIAELCLLHVASNQGSDPLEVLQQEALRLRNLLKFEFFFAEKKEYLEALEHDLNLRMPGWRDKIEDGSAAVYQLLRQSQPLLAHGTLRPFLESYLVVAEALVLTPTTDLIDSKQLLKESMELGRQRVLQRRIQSQESVDKVYLENGILVAQDRDLLADDENARAGREGLYSELSALNRRTQFIASLAENRRLGLDLDGSVST